MSHPTLKATYTSPSAPPKDFVHHLPSPPLRPTTESRLTHLAALRASVTELQDSVNKFLTAEMEAEKASNGSSGGNAANDAKEEENYGEEAVEDD